MNSGVGTGLWYFRARYYSGSLGRFVNRDPLGYVDGWNLYAGYFVPNHLDPLGRTFTESESSSPMADIRNQFGNNFYAFTEAPQTEREKDEVKESDNQCCAWVEKSVSIDVKAKSTVPSDAPGPFYTQNGLTDIKRHEALRRKIYKMGYDEYLKQVQTEEDGSQPKKCGTICRSTPGQAKVALEEYLVRMRKAAKKQYFDYWLQEQKNVDAVENNSAIYDGDVLMGTAKKYTPNPPPSLTPEACP